MKNNNIISKNSIQKKYLDSKFNKKLNIRFSNNINNIFSNLDNKKNIFHSLSKKFKFNFEKKDLSKFKKFKIVAVIGMGGSILGSEAIYCFLRKKIKKKIIFFNDINSNELYNFKKNHNLKKVLFLIISKSGNTVETLSNFLALNIIKKKSKNIIIITEKNKNFLHNISKKMSLNYIEHKKYMGGRYSVLSEVGIVPAYLMGLDIIKLRKNILNHFKSKNVKFLRESTIKLSNIFQKNRFKNIIFLNYDSKLNKFLYWHQQLMAESLGKKGKGFLPSISKAPKDHHSLLQLYLDGPKDKLFYIFSADNEKDEKIKSQFLKKKQNFLNNKSLSQIKEAQKNAFIKALKKKAIPFREFKIKKINEQTLGELFSYFMLEISLIGKLLDINPFDQPAVEQVKVSTKKLLT